MAEERDPYYEKYMKFYRQDGRPAMLGSDLKAPVTEEPKVRLEGPSYSPVEVGRRRQVYDRTGFK